MRLSAQSSQFRFNLPQSFIPIELLDRYQKILDKNWIQYENAIDYLNSTIKSVNFPGISFEMPKQMLLYGKERYYKPAQNIQDIITTRELQITFRSVDSDLNYWMMFDIINAHYKDVVNQYLQPFTLSCLDIHRDEIYKIVFNEIILRSLGDMNFSYSSQRVASKDFTLTFNFNFYDIEFMLDESKVIDTTGIPFIFNKNDK